MRTIDKMLKQLTSADIAIRTLQDNKDLDRVYVSHEWLSAIRTGLQQTIDTVKKDNEAIRERRERV